MHRIKDRHDKALKELQKAIKKGDLACTVSTKGWRAN
jgi:hypothetical protein